MYYFCFMNKEFIQKLASHVKKGVLSFIVLIVLNDRECYGYELIEEVKKYTKIEIAEGTLYPLMNRLKKEGLVDSKWVEQESGIPRKYYHLTEGGVKNLKEMEEYWEILVKAVAKI